MLKIFATLLSFIGVNGVAASNFTPNTYANQETINALIENGSDPNKPHPIEHHFDCYDSASLQNLMTKGVSLGYRAENIGDGIHQGVHYWYGDLIKNMILDLELINKENLPC